MFEECRLPPIFRLVPVASARPVVAEARAMAAAGADPATVLCAAREDAFDCAVVLRPEVALDEARLVVYVAMLGLGDALGAVVPAGIDVTFRWPNVLEANVGAAGRLGLDAPAETAPDAIPDWLVLHVELALGPLDGGFPRQGFPETSLRDEGCAEISAALLVESFARHFLTWMNRWQEDGFAPVRAMWLRHAPSHGKTIRVALGGRRLSGTFEGIDDRGAAVLAGRKATRRIALDRALAG